MMDNLSQEELKWRISLDFTKTEEQVIDELREFMPELSEQQIALWEKNGTLEYRIIDNHKRYFRRAARNVFRIDPFAKTFFCKKYGDEKEGRRLFLAEYLPKIIKKTDEKTFNLRFKLTIKPDAVPKGEVIRCWLPYPMECQYQTVLHLELQNYNGIKSYPKSEHSSIYLEKITVAGKATIFETVFSFSTKSFFYKNDENKHISYTHKDLEQQYPHIVFSKKIENLSSEIVGTEQDKKQIAKRIFCWISENIEWAVAREYSTIENIPHYVIDNRHGDCGQVTLLFITLCRYNNIPARWISGFMLHPNYENLHDWCEIYLENYGWTPVDVSFGVQKWSDDEDIKYFYFMGIDAYRLIINRGISDKLYPQKYFHRSETVDFQRGEVEWKNGNIYFDNADYELITTMQNQGSI